LKKKVRWSMNSKQGSRYIKRRMRNDLKQKILVQNGIISEHQVSSSSLHLYHFGYRQQSISVQTWYLLRVHLLYPQKFYLQPFVVYPVTFDIPFCC
jgi:hypothetical protein